MIYWRKNLHGFVDEHGRTVPRSKVAEDGDVLRVPMLLMDGEGDGAANVRHNPGPVARADAASRAAFDKADEAFDAYNARISNAWRTPSSEQTDKRHDRRDPASGKFVAEEAEAKRDAARDAYQARLQNAWKRAA